MVLTRAWASATSLVVAAVTPAASANLRQSPTAAPTSSTITSTSLAPSPCFAPRFSMGLRGFAAFAVYVEIVFATGACGVSQVIGRREPPVAARVHEIRMLAHVVVAIHVPASALGSQW